VNAAAQDLDDLHASRGSDDTKGTAAGVDKHGIAAIEHKLERGATAAEVQVEHELDRLADATSLKQKASWLRTYVGAVVEHHHFMAVSMFVVVANAVEMAFTTDRVIIYVIHNPGTAEPTTLPFVDILSLLFYGWYVVELFMKLLASRRSFFPGRDNTWNMFDLFLILVSTFAQIEDILSVTQKSTVPALATCEACNFSVTSGGPHGAITGLRYGPRSHNGPARVVPGAREARYGSVGPNGRPLRLRGALRNP